MNAPVNIDRRRVLAGGGALIVSFSLSGALAQQQGAPAAAPAPSPPGSLKNSPYLDAWIRIDANGSIEVFTGKAELGQGFKTAFQQIAAEELGVAFESLKVTTADTGLTANEGYTSGSNSMKDSGTAIQNAAAQARELLLAEAANRLGLPIETLWTAEGAVIAPNVVLSASVPVIDVTASDPVEHRGHVPPRSVVLPGTRPKTFPAGSYDLPCALIVGERSASTDLKTSLNDVLREFEIAT